MNVPDLRITMGGNNLGVVPMKTSNNEGCAMVEGRWAMGGSAFFRFAVRSGFRVLPMSRFPGELRIGALPVRLDPCRSSRLRTRKPRAALRPSWGSDGASQAPDGLWAMGHGPR